MDNKELLKEAKKAMEQSYAPYSKFNVGAAILTKSGKIFRGCNIENATYGATNCAERTAIFNAVSCGEREFERIAVVSSSKDQTFPCGICRQVMAEFMPDGTVILENANGEVFEYSCEQLLPHSFKL